MNKDDKIAKEEMEMRFALSDVMRNIINKSENGEIALPEFLDEVKSIWQTGNNLLKTFN